MGNRLLRGADKDQDRRQGPGISPTDIADHNSRAAVGLLLRWGAMTRQELASRLGLTEQAVTGIMRRLMVSGLCRQTKSEAGARNGAAEFALVPDAAHATGLYLHPTGVEAVRIDLTGRVVEHSVFGSGDPIALLRRHLASDSGETRVGIGIACHPNSGLRFEDVKAELGEFQPLWLQDTEAALVAERLLGIGEPEGGLVVILIDDLVRAGLLIGGRFFRGRHGRAGKIGAFGSGSPEGSLDDVLGAASFAACQELGDEAALDAWIGRAADRLLRAIVAIAGLVSPGIILIGGTLPDPVVDRIIALMTLDQRRQAEHFVPAPWIAPIRKVTFGGAGVARGAAMMPIIGRFLPNLDRR